MDEPDWMADLRHTLIREVHAAEDAYLSDDGAVYVLVSKDSLAVRREILQVLVTMNCPADAYVETADGLLARCTYVGAVGSLKT
jgi:hypothetical protein